MAALLAGGSGAVLSHAAAAAHWGIRPTGGRIVDVTAPGQRRSRDGIRFHRSHLPPDEVTVHEGIPVTTVARTLFDLAAGLRLGQLRRAVHEVEVRRLWDKTSLADLLERHPRRPGAPAIRTVLAEPGAGFTRNDLEDDFAALLERHALPGPACNAPLEVGGRWIEPDCVWHGQRLIVELDGGAAHHTRRAFEADRARDRALAARGWRVIRITWRQLHQEPEAVARDLRAAMRARR